MVKITLVSSHQTQMMDKRQVILLAEPGIGDDAAAVKTALDAEYPDVWPMSVAISPKLKTWMSGTNGWESTEE